MSYWANFRRALDGGYHLMLCALASLVLLTFAAYFWPDFFLFSKYLRLPAWASLLPTPARAGAYLVTLALLPVAWGARQLDSAILMTFAVILVMPFVPLSAYVAQAAGMPYFWAGFLLNYLFVLSVSLAKPALALLALRWAAQTWVALK